MILVCSFLVLFGGCKSEEKDSSGSWELVWSDEFEGNQLDGTKWRIQTGPGPWGLNELEYYSDAATNVACSDGNLVITARKEDYGGRNYTSGRLMSKQTFTLGKIEARIKLPWGQGMFPAFWTLTDNYDEPGKYGEIDILEMVGSANGVENATIWGSAHRSDLNNLPDGLKSVSKAYTTPDYSRFNKAYHVFTVEKYIDRLLFYVDGNLFMTQMMNSDGSDGFSNLQDNPANIIMNLAVGGSWAGDPDATTQWPQQMCIDYVRYYQWKEN